MQSPAQSLVGQRFWIDWGCPRDFYSDDSHEAAHTANTCLSGYFHSVQRIHEHIDEERSQSGLRFDRSRIDIDQIRRPQLSQPFWGRFGIWVRLLLYDVVLGVQSGRSESAAPGNVFNTIRPENLGVR